MVEDIRINVTWRNHRKRKKLEKTLGPQGIVSWYDLLLSVRQNRPNGILTNMDEEDISEEANWPGDPNEFVKGLIKCRLLDKNRNWYSIHNWEKNNPYAFHTKNRSEKAKKAAAVKWGSKKDTINSQTRSKRLAVAREKGRHTDEEWQEIVNFFKGKCVKCDGESRLYGVVKDHIVPIYQGGSDSINNLQPLCAKCNSAKGADNTDYRLIYCEIKSLEMPAQWLHDACGMPAKPNKMPAPSPSPSPSPSPNPLRNKSTDLEKEIEDLKKEISQLVKRHIFNPYEFDKKNEKKHPEARLQVLIRAKQEIEKGNKEFLENPWKLLTHIMTVEHQNANERGGMRGHDAKKLELKKVVEQLK